MKIEKINLKQSIKLSLAILLTVVILTSTVKVIGIYRKGVKVLNDVTQIKEAVQIPPSREDLENIEPLLETLQGDIKSLRTEVDPYLWLAPYGSWIPIYGCEVVAAPQLLDLAEALTDSSLDSFQAGQPIIKAYQSDDIDVNLELVVETLVQAQPQFIKAQKKFIMAQAARENIDIGCLSPTLSKLLTNRVDPFMQLMEDGLSVAIEFPNMVGAMKDGPRRYLLLAQNEDELRPTGGFITAAGILLIENGQITSLEFIDSGDLDDWSKIYPAAPWQLRHYMNSPVLIFRDANWFPDFQTSSLYAEYLYSYIDENSFDGVIAFDQRVLAELLTVLGPIKLQNEQILIDSNNILPYLRSAKIESTTILLNSPELTRKSYLNDIAAGLLEKFTEGNYEFEELFSISIKLLNERHILVQLNDPVMKTLISRNGWDGRLQAGLADFLYVIDSNIGFNKTNAIINTSFTYDVNLTDLKNPESELTITHNNPADNKIPCVQWDGFTLKGQKKYPIDRCYWNYLRIYTTAGAELLESNPQAIPADWMIRRQSVSPEVDILEDEIDGVQGFGLLKVVPGGQSIGTTMKFKLPNTIVRTQLDMQNMVYHLRVQKQPGTVAIPITIRVHFSNAAIILSTNPEAVVQENNILLDTNLKVDRELEIFFLSAGTSP